MTVVGGKISRGLVFEYVIIGSIFTEGCGVFRAKENQS